MCHFTLVILRVWRDSCVSCVWDLGVWHVGAYIYTYLHIYIYTYIHIYIYTYIHMCMQMCTQTKWHVSVQLGREASDSGQYCLEILCSRVSCSVLLCVVAAQRGEWAWALLARDAWTHCNTLQRTATHCNTLQHTATHCDTLRHTATLCNTLQHTADRQRSERPWAMARNALTLSNTLQHTATHCNTLQHTATHYR